MEDFSNVFYAFAERSLSVSQQTNDILLFLISCSSAFLVLFVIYKLIRIFV